MWRYAAAPRRLCQLVDGVFRVRDVARYAKYPGSADIFVMTLTDGIDEFDAITGAATTAIVVGTAVQVRGCVVARGGRPLIVAGSLRPIIAPDCLSSDFVHPISAPRAQGVASRTRA